MKNINYKSIFKNSIININHINIENTDLTQTIKYKAQTWDNSNIFVYAYKNDDLIYLAEVKSNCEVLIPINNPKDYIDHDGNITLVSVSDTYISNSNTLLWVTDTQYYTRFDDLNSTYKTIAEYAVNEFKNNRIGYLVHTGDVADEYDPCENAKKQFEIAGEIHKIIDDADLPNGIVSGNHDVGGTALSDHRFFCEIFGEDRYKHRPWYGGSLNNNQSHYDLISLGNYDFVFLYIAYGLEDKPETVDWANSVLKKYDNRNAIICTHAYLDHTGEWVINHQAKMSYMHSRAKEIWDNIIVHNANVIAVLSGHTPGVARNKRFVSDDRYVWEFLADYQFAEYEETKEHILNGIHCNGEGFVRLISFEDDKMKHKTYSPLYDRFNFFDKTDDEFDVELLLKKADRYIKVLTLEIVL